MMIMEFEWQSIQVYSPHLSKPVNVIAAKNIPYVNGGHKFQTFNIYTRRTDSTVKLIDQVASNLPSMATITDKPRWHVHIHGGAWRDPFLTAESAEPLVACAFSGGDGPIDTFVSINYTLSPFPTHQTAPYDPSTGDTGQPWREARHPEHLRDVLTAFKVLQSFGLADDSYLLSGHSCGACIAFQSVLQEPGHWNSKDDLPPPPRPYALMGLNGLYDLVTLVNGLGPSHKNMREDYERFVSIAFGPDKPEWEHYSPARFDSDEISRGIEKGHSPKRILLDQSIEDQLVPFNQLQRMKTQLEQVVGLQLMQGKRCVGAHAEPWEQGHMIWETILDVLAASE